MQTIEPTKTHSKRRVLLWLLALAGLLILLLPPECLRSWREQLSQRKK
mgnify:CR=1 FL=1